jgi:integrase/recombinase XerD
MSLNLYRRHSTDCEVYTRVVRRAARRFYMACACPIWIYGRTSKTRVPRQSLRTCDLSEAQAILRSMEADVKDEIIHGPRLTECITKYLASRKEDLTPETLANHKRMLQRFEEYCKSCNTYFIRELTVDLLETFKTAGLSGLAASTKFTNIATLRCFLRHAYRREWLAEQIVERVQPYQVERAQKEPFNDAEVEALLAGALTLAGDPHTYAGQPQTFQLLLRLMLETGMRVGDAAQFEPAQLVRGENLWVYTYSPQKQRRVKNKKLVESYITDSLKTAIDACVWLSPLRPFAYGNNQPLHLHIKVYEYMQLIGRRCNIPDCRPHRLRDTFAVRALLRGLALEDVSRLLGHSSVRVTELYYAKWVPARKRRLERLVAEAFVDTRSNALGDTDARVASAVAADVVEA